jgi:zinc/manganese transport system substrate-binding protein
VTKDPIMTTTTRALAAALAALLLVLHGGPARADGKRRIACPLPTLAAIVREVGGDRVDAFSLGAGDQDPHVVSPTPSLMKKVRGADMLIELGMQLENWADQVADGSGNARLFRGAAGRVALSSGIAKLEVPTSLSRAQGDVHPEGNPHLWLDPVRAKLMAGNVAAALKAASPADAAYFDARLAAFEKRIDRALFGDELLKVVGSRKLTRLVLDGRLHEFLESRDYQGKKLSALAGGWLAKARPLRGRKAMEFHKVWAYFAATFGFELIGTIEEKPGIAPGPRYVKETIERARANHVTMILVDNVYDPALPRRIARDAGTTAIVLPDQVAGEPGIDDYFQLIDHILDRLTAGAR